MGDHLDRLLVSQSVIHGPVQVECYLRHLTGRYKCADCNQTAIPWGERGAKPEVMEQKFRGVVDETLKLRTHD